jgi:hypothetical protein
MSHEKEIETMKALLHSAKPVLCGLLTCLGLAVLGPAAQADILRPVNTSGGRAPHGTTMHESYRVFPDGTRVPGTGTTTSVLVRGSTAILTAPAAISGTLPGTVYEFQFWDLAGHLRTNHRTTVKVPTGQAAFRADAWYLLTGGGPCTNPAGCPTYMTTYGFSLPAHKTLPGSPIASVVPVSPSVWTPPSATVATTTAATITAATPLDSLHFVHWLAPGATATGTQLAVGAGVSTLAIAFYGPDPCEWILGDAPYPWELPPAAYQAAMRAIAAEYHACEVSHGA